MKKPLLFAAIAFLLSTPYGFSYNRQSSAPYIAGDSFRACADFVIDETLELFYPDEVEYGDIIFLKTDYLDWFIHHANQHIHHPYVLITHNSDYGVPEKYAFFLNNEKLLAWFARNVDGTTHPKLHPIPIGVANSHLEHGNLVELDAFRDPWMKNAREHLLYMNFALSTYFWERFRVYQMFSCAPFCLYSPAKSFRAYLVDLSSCKFVLSPRGNGLDCHRTWEALYTGTIPIVVTSPLDPLFEDLPVLVINDWSEVTEELLETTYRAYRERCSQGQWKMEKLDFDYWLKQMRSFKVIHKQPEESVFDGASSHADEYDKD